MIPKHAAVVLLPGHAVSNINADQQKPAQVKPMLMSHGFCVAGNW